MSLSYHHFFILFREKELNQKIRALLSDSGFLLAMLRTDSTIYWHWTDAVTADWLDVETTLANTQHAIQRSIAQESHYSSSFVWFLNIKILNEKFFARNKKALVAVYCAKNEFKRKRQQQNHFLIGISIENRNVISFNEIVMILIIEKIPSLH